MDDSAESGMTPFLRIREISKAFGGANALSDVSLDIRAGVVHGLVGANGAGKSTLIRCLAGLEQPDSGTVEIDGRPVVISNPDEASALGLAFIHQEVSLIPGWDVLRNMSLGVRPSTRAGLIDWRPTRLRAQEVAQMLGIGFNLTTPVQELTTAEQWLVLIGRALMRDARMIAMDEPTASLSAAEADRVHQIIRSLVAKGTAVLFVSHRLDEVSALCTDITVFKDGHVTKRVVDEPVSKPELVRAIVGRDLEIPEAGHDSSSPLGEVVLEVRGLGDKRMVRDVSFRVHAGEILGLGGLVGAGRTEVVKMIYGESRRSRGEIILNGETIRFAQPTDAVKAGIGFVPEERRSEGVFLDRTINFNINIASLASMTVGRLLPLLKMAEGRRRAQAAAKRVTVKARGVNEVVANLSGGNQQKVLIARWLIDMPKVLILDEPSRGVDVGARAEVHDVIRELASQGTVVIVVSSDNEELVALCDRVVVMSEGRVAGELRGSNITIDHIVHLSFGSETDTREAVA